MLVQVFRFDVQTVPLPVCAGVVHHYSYAVGLYLLRAQGDVHPVRQKHLCLGGEVHAVGPEVLLVGQTAAVEESGFKYYWEAGIDVVADGGTHIAHVAHLLGYE